MKYLISPSSRTVALTNVIGEPITFRREVTTGQQTKLVAEPQIANWWDFVLASAGDPNFFDKIDNQLEAIELGVAFRTTILAAKREDFNVVPLENDVAKRLQGSVLKREFDRNTQHNFVDWVRAIANMSDTDPASADPAVA